MKREAFTLVELLVVIAVIGILVAFTVPGINKARKAAHAARCSANLKELHGAVAAYVEDHRGAYPRSAVLASAPEFAWRDVLVPSDKSISFRWSRLARRLEADTAYSVCLSGRASDRVGKSLRDQCVFDPVEPSN